MDTTQYLYSCLIKNLHGEELKQDFSNADSYEFNDDQIDILEYYCNHQDEIVKLFSSNLGEN
ncbi:MAG: hypothetical protein MJ195_00390 [Mycoplasmoidaceae bacterium]|nr:hypothetical protein [Mycoplasmoidaceae bacterium]